MPSQLSFAATEALRKKLLLRNLTPYTKTGVYVPSSQPASGELLQNDYSVIDSPDILIDANPFANQLYTRNEFGPEGGFSLDIDGLINTAETDANKGPYGSYPPYTDALQVYSTSFQQKQYVKNVYSPGNGYNSYYDIGDISKVQKNATYWDPPSFRPSLYSPYTVLLQPDPLGDSGPASLDSTMAQIGVEQAKKMFQYRVDQNVRTETIGRVNILNGLQDPVNLSQILAGRRPIIDRDWKITSGGGNIISQGQDIVQRIAGFTLPFSPIPGDYFEQDNIQRDFDSTQSLIQAEGNFFQRLVGGLFGLSSSRGKSPSQLFLDYTGSGQRAQLTSNLDENRFRPQYNTGGTGIISALGNAILGGFARNASQGTYYVGSPEREPSYLNSPPGQIPIDPFGQQVSAPVYGNDILAKDYEGSDQNFNFGLAGRAFEDEGDLSGGFSWVSQKWAPNAGRKQTPGGDYGTESPDYPLISGQFVAGESINYDFKPGSILDDTQRLIDSVPNTGARFGHVGNAIDQTSKVFNDGYKEITKGSKVIKYTDGQQNVGIEYCRLFSKDTPYYTFQDLQKSEGNIRKSSYSILDSTFNLNISPTKGKDSTNIINGSVKKYMFSIENLAWRTGSRPGYRVQDLPECEKGPNGGRIMWFPPYDLDFNEDTRPDFNETSFVGRPEPVYTYKSTSRSGTIKWKVIVDHPSVLNLIVNKVLANEGDRPKVDSIINSFFAGCKKYDLYELAKIYNTVPLTELQAWQQIITNPNVTQEQYQEALQNIQPEEAQTPTGGGSQSQAEPVEDLNASYANYAFYFDNDIPGPAGSNQNWNTTTSIDYQQTYSSYTSASNKSTYENNALNKEAVAKFFSDTIEENFSQIEELGVKIFNMLDQKQAKSVSIQLLGSASAPASVRYNQALSLRRTSSIQNFFNTYSFPGGKSLKQFIDNGQIIFNPAGSGETITVTPRGKTQTYGSVNCTTNLTGKDKIYSTNAMACRAVTIQNIKIEPIEAQPQPANVDVAANLAADGKKPGVSSEGSQSSQPIPQVVQPTDALYKGASKKLLRYLLSECDYFEVMKLENPFIYDSLKDKLKYFSPAFHSTTPEGLNARLTFLQQCMRPGDTIPTIGPNGEKLYNDATNTSFGAPPVLVLRIGDFYNTKIIPRGLQITYEKLYDMNPEGIGFQPMIADINLSFNFVGGSGIANPVDTLQNALSFNYYANTELYDERAEATEDTSKLDKEVIQSIQNSNPTVGASNLTNQQKTNGGNTIGTQTVTGSTSTGENGTIAYKTFMNELVTQTGGYFNATMNFMDNVLKNYNYGILSLLNTTSKKNRGYNEGDLGATTTTIYGRPMQYQTFVDQAFKKLSNQIDGGNLPIFNESGFKNPNIKAAQKRLFKKNYQDYIATYQSSFLNALTQDLSTLVQSEQDLVFNFDRINFVLDGSSATQGYDGKIDKQNVSIIFATTGTTETVNGSSVNTYTNLGTDITTLSTDVANLISNLETIGLYDTNYSTASSSYTPAPSDNITKTLLPTDNAKLEYMLMSKALLNNPQDFVDKLKVGLDQATGNAVQFYYNGLGNSNSYYNNWKKVNENNVKILTNFKTGTVGKNFVEYTPSFGTTQERVVLFSTDLSASNAKKKTLQDIYSNKNNNGNINPFNFKRNFK